MKNFKVLNNIKKGLFFVVNKMTKYKMPRKFKIMEEITIVAVQSEGILFKLLLLK